MPDITETRWCQHGKRHDDGCSECRYLELADEARRLVKRYEEDVVEFPRYLLTDIANAIEALCKEDS